MMIIGLSKTVIQTPNSDILLMNQGAGNGFPKPWPVLCCTVGHFQHGKVMDKRGGIRPCAFEGAHFSLASDIQGGGLGWGAWPTAPSSLNMPSSTLTGSGLKFLQLLVPQISNNFKRNGFLS